MQPVELQQFVARTRRDRQVLSIQACTRCDRRESRLPIVGKGPVPSKLMLLIDVPSAVTPYLDRTLVKTNLPPRTHWYVATVVKCGSGAIEALPAALCLDHLRSEINLVNPSWVLSMGVPALTATGIRDQLKKIHGRPFIPPAGPFIGRKVFPTFHPGVAFKDQHNANLLTADLSTLYGLFSGRIASQSVMARVGRGGKLNLNVEA